MNLLIKEEEFLKYGNKQKDFFQMNDEEKKKWREKLQQKPRIFFFPMDSLWSMKKTDKWLQNMQTEK